VTRLSIAAKDVRRRSSFARPDLLGGAEAPKAQQSALTGTMAEDIRQRFRSTTSQAGSGEAKQIAADAWKVACLATSMEISVEEIRDGARIFESLDSDRSGKLCYEKFEIAAERVIKSNADPSNGKSTDVEAVKLFCQDHWTCAKHERDESEMDLQEFLEWYSRNRFNPDLVCTRDQRLHLDLARKYRCPEKSIHDMKLSYDQSEQDEDGEIGVDAFAGLLKMLMKLPGDAEMPRERVLLWWREIDADGSGNVCFEEFLQWWISRRHTLTPYDNYYRTIRDLSKCTLDPRVHYGQ